MSDDEKTIGFGPDTDENENIKELVEAQTFGKRIEYMPGVYLVPRPSTKKISIFEKGAAKVAYWSDWVSMGAIIFLLAMTFADVILRTFFNMPFSGTYDWTRYAMVLVATFGMPLCTMNDEHVCIDILFRKFPDKIQSVLLWFNYIVVAFFLYLLITQDWNQGIVNASMGQTSAGVPWPTYPFYYFIAIGFACMLSIVIVKMINLGRGVK